MLKKTTLLIFIVFIAILGIDFLNNETLTSTSGGPAGHTGSPGDGKNCTSCHTGAAAVPNAAVITSTIPANGYLPGSTYTITASVTGSSSKFGFQVSPQNTSGALLGSLISTSSQTKIVNSKYITHTSSGVSGTGSKTWAFDWTAPAAGTGSVTFYGAFNVTNSNGATSGDTVKLATLAVSETPTITSFKFSALTPEVTGTINEADSTIKLFVPAGTDLTALVPTVTHTGASVNPASGAANDFSSPQVYTVTASNSATRSYTVTVDFNTSIREEGENTFLIFPNPVSDELNIKLSGNEAAAISVININGKTVKSFSLDKRTAAYNFSELVPGIYFIKIETEKGSIVKKLVKQ